MMFTEALFLIALYQNLPKCPSGICRKTVDFSHNGILHTNDNKGFIKYIQ